jgi:hypothetical protein
MIEQYLKGLCESLFSTVRLSQPSFIRNRAQFPELSRPETTFTKDSEH